MKVINALWQMVTTYWKYRNYDPVLKTSVLLIGSAILLIPSVPLTFFLATSLFEVPLWVEVSSDSVFWLAVGMLAVGVVLLLWRSSSLQKQITGVLIVQRFMAGMSATNPKQVLPTQMKLGELVIIDQDEQSSQRDGVVIDPAGMLRKVNNLDEVLQSHLGRELAVPVAYAGLAPVPILVAAGYRLTSRQQVIFLDFDRDTGWHMLDDLDDGEQLEMTQPRLAPTTQVGLVLSISASINPNDVPRPIVDNCYFGAVSKGPRRDSASSEYKQKRICRELYDLLASIRSRHSEVETVHVFLASQASFAVRFGSTITQSVHPAVRVYQYEKGEYTWSILVNSGQEPTLVPSCPQSH